MRVTDTLPQLALREWRAEFAKPATVPAVIGIAVLLMIAGPFETNALLRPLPRLAYWLALVVSTYSIGIIVSAIIQHRFPGLTGWPSLAVTAIAIGACVTVAVLALNYAALGVWPTRQVLLPSIGNIMGIAVVITFLLSLPMGQPKSTGAPPVLDRLPVDKRGALMALSVEDHYTRVRTTKGDHLVLMRLGDAIKEVGETQGAHVHRSHWVAFGAVSAARRDGDRAILTLTDSTEVPVSRANIAKIKDAGLFPK